MKPYEITEWHGEWRAMHQAYACIGFQIAMMKIKWHVKDNVKEKECSCKFFEMFYWKWSTPFSKTTQMEGCKLVPLEEKGHTLALGGLRMEANLDC
jgi:hypothetical protein